MLGKGAAVEKDDELVCDHGHKLSADTGAPCDSSSTSLASNAVTRKPIMLREIPSSLGIIQARCGRSSRRHRGRSDRR